MLIARTKSSQESRGSVWHHMALVFPKAHYSSCAVEANLRDEDNKPTVKLGVHLSTDIGNLPVSDMQSGTSTVFRYIQYSAYQYPRTINAWLEL